MSFVCISIQLRKGVNCMKSILRKIDNIDWFAIEVFVNWSDSTYGNAAEIAIYLKNLFSGNTDLALDAAHELWCSLCHQHSYITSAAVPAYDFLIAGLKELDDEIKVEILDILVGFAVCTCDTRYELSKKQPLNWEITLRQKLSDDIKLFQGLSSHVNEDISYFAEQIVSNLNT